MDAGRIWLVSAIASVSVGLQLTFALPQSAPGATEHTAYFAGQAGWPGAAPPNSAPSYTAPGYPPANNTAPSYDRYAAPAAGSSSTYAQPATISQRTQNAVSETSTTLRDGMNAGIRAVKDGGQGFTQQMQDWTGAAPPPLPSAGSTVRSGAEQAPGTTSGQSKYTNPFAPPAPAATTSTSSRGIAAPPWASSPVATPPAAPLSQNWSDTSSATTSTAPASNDWTSIGTTIASPPLLIPQLNSSSATSSTTGFAPSDSAAPVATIAGSGRPPFPSDQTREDTTRSLLTNSAQKSQLTQPTINNRTATDEWANAWNSSPSTPQASIVREGNSSARTDVTRDFNTTPAQSVAAAPPDAKKTTASKSDDLWGDDPWGKTPPSSPAGLAAPTITATSNKPAPGAANTASPAGQPAATLPALNAPMFGPAPSNPNFAGQSNTTLAGSPPNVIQTATPANPPNRSQAAAPETGEPKPWLAMAAAVLSLAGSLAANIYLGWSYLDARQKYQSLVRRTADTFRRTKASAA